MSDTKKYESFAEAAKAHPDKVRVASMNLIIARIDSMIDFLHICPFQFCSGSTIDRLISELDGARVTARAIINLEKTNADPTERDPNLDPDR